MRVLRLGLMITSDSRREEVQRHREPAEEERQKVPGSSDRSEGRASSRREKRSISSVLYLRTQRLSPAQKANPS